MPVASTIAPAKTINTVKEKTFHHRDTENTEKTKSLALKTNPVFLAFNLDFLCVLCASVVQIF
jgi:hypothetical protein